MFLLVFVLFTGGRGLPAEGANATCLQRGGGQPAEGGVCLQSRGEGICLQGWGLPTGGGADPPIPEPEKRAVPFLLECFLVHINCSFITLDYTVR